MEHWIWWILLFSHNFANIESYHSAGRGLLKTSPMWYYFGGSVLRLIPPPPPIPLISLILLNMDILYWRLFLKYSCICMLWWRESYCIFLWYLDLIWLSWIVRMPLDLFLQLLEPMNWFYLFQGMISSVSYYFFTGRHRACCDVHGIGKWYQWEYPLV